MNPLICALPAADRLFQFGFLYHFFTYDFDKKHKISILLEIMQERLEMNFGCDICSMMEME